MESGNYVIIRKAPIRMTMVTNKAVVEDKIYSVSGYVFDEQSGAAINEASVYEKKQLASALTNDAGYFKLKLKNSKTSTATLFISKEFYEDTTIVIEPRHNQEITITMMPVEKEEDKVTVAPEDYLVLIRSKQLQIQFQKLMHFQSIRQRWKEQEWECSCFLLNKKCRALT